MGPQSLSSLPLGLCWLSTATGCIELRLHLDSSWSGVKLADIMFPLPNVVQHKAQVGWNEAAEAFAKIAR